MWPLGLYNKGENKIGIEEFREIFLDLYPDLCLYALKFVGDYDTSKDIAQDVLTNFWEENHKLINKNLIKPYLFKAVKNKSLNYNKREKRKIGLDALLEQSKDELKDTSSNDIVSEISFWNLQKELEEAVVELPEQRQKIFRMSRFDQMKHKEIAEELGLSPKTVETQIYRSLAFLRQKLKHYLN